MNALAWSVGGLFLASVGGLILAFTRLQTSHERSRRYIPPPCPTSSEVVAGVVSDAAVHGYGEWADRDGERVSLKKVDEAWMAEVGKSRITFEDLQEASIRLTRILGHRRGR